MSITGKIRFGLGVILGFLILQFALGQYLDFITQKNVDSAVTKNFGASELLAETGVVAQQLRRYEKEFFIYVNDEKGRAKYRKEWTGSFDKLRSGLTAMIANKDAIFTQRDLIELNSWSAALDFYGSEFKKIMVLADESKIISAPTIEEPKVRAKGAPAPIVAPIDLSEATKLANEMIGPGKDRFRELLDGTEKMRKAKINDSRVSVNQIRAAFNNGAIASVAIFVFGLIVAIYMMVSVPNAVKKPIEEFVLIADKISKGDTTKAIYAEGVAEFHGLAKALERLRVAQGGLLEKLRSRAASPFQ